MKATPYTFACLTLLMVALSIHTIHAQDTIINKSHLVRHWEVDIARAAFRGYSTTGNYNPRELRFLWIKPTEKPGKSIRRAVALQWIDFRDYDDRFTDSSLINFPRDFFRPDGRTYGGGIGFSWGREKHFRFTPRWHVVFGYDVPLNVGYLRSEFSYYDYINRVRRDNGYRNAVYVEGGLVLFSGLRYQKPGNPWHVRFDFNLPVRIMMLQSVRMSDIGDHASFVFVPSGINNFYSVVGISFGKDF
jgi:hypothetical protein